jgi:hypothetical protein
VRDVRDVRDNRDVRDVTPNRDVRDVTPNRDVTDNRDRTDAVMGVVTASMRDAVMTDARAETPVMVVDTTVLTVMDATDAVVVVEETADTTVIIVHMTLRSSVRNAN